MKYQDWTKSLAEDTLKRALKTADKVLADADNTYLDGSDLEKLHDCWEIIEITSGILKDSEEKEEAETPVSANMNNGMYNN